MKSKVRWLRLALNITSTEYCICETAFAWDTAASAVDRTARAFPAVLKESALVTGMGLPSIRPRVSVHLPGPLPEERVRPIKDGGERRGRRRKGEEGTGLSLASSRLEEPFLDFLPRDPRAPARGSEREPGRRVREGENGRDSKTTVCWIRFPSPALLAVAGGS